MSNFIYDNVPLEPAKSDLTPIPVGANPQQYVQASDWNLHRQALLDIQTVLRSSPSLNVRDFGAKGDGVTDDYPAFAAALAALPPINSYGTVAGTITVPAGNFLLSQPLIISNIGNVRIKGEGRFQTMLVSPNNAPTTPQLFGGHMIQAIDQTGANGSKTFTYVSSLVTGSGQAISVSSTQTGANFAAMDARRSGMVELNGLTALTAEAFINIPSGGGGMVNGQPYPILRSWGQISQNGLINSGKGAFNIQVTRNSPNNYTLGCSIQTGAGTFSVNHPTTVVEATTYHVALSYDGANLRIFLAGNGNSVAANGTIVQAFCEMVTYGGHSVAWPFSLTTATFSGTLDSLRISNSARYTSNFTAPTAKLPCDSGTIYSQNFDNVVGTIPVAQQFNSFGNIKIWTPTHFSNSGTYAASALTITGIGISGNCGGVLCDGSPNAFFSDMSYSGTNSAFDLNDSFQMMLQKLYLFSFGGWSSSPSPTGAQVGLLMRAACGFSEITDASINGFAFGISTGCNGMFNSCSIGVSNQAISGYHIQHQSVFDDVVMKGCGVDLEGSAPNMRSSVISCGAQKIQMLGCAWDVSIAGAPVACVEMEGNANPSNISMMDCLFASNVAGTLIKQTGTTGSINLVISNSQEVTGNSHTWSNVMSNIVAIGGELGGPGGLYVGSGITSTTTPAKNLRGQVTVSGAATTGTATFATAETNATYFVELTPTASTGTPAAGSNRVLSVAKNAGNFVVTVEAAPGVGNTVTFDWALTR